MWDEPSTPRERAQELMWDAMDASSEKEMVDLSRRALEIYPDCVDALMMLAVLESRWVKDLIEGMRHAVAAGRRDLGARFFKQNQGMFWGLIETRPFMQAMAGLVDALRQTMEIEHTEEAIMLTEEMLTLNPNDNQGMRVLLLGAYLERKRYGEAEKLLKRYPGEGMAAYWWGRVLLAFLSGDEKKAESTLKAARKRNRFVLAYLSGRKRLPRQLPEMYAVGSREEAMLCANWMWRAWRAHPKAVKWLKGVAGMKPVKRGKREGKGERGARSRGLRRRIFG